MFASFLRPPRLLLSAMLLLSSDGLAVAQDGDGDGVVDSQDNCVVVANPTQLDTNRDGFGNRCDTDYDNNGVCAATDFSAFKAAYLSMVGQPNYNPDVDANGDGVIAAGDLSIFKNYYLQNVGPSGLDCAVTPPTTPCACDMPVLRDAGAEASGDVALGWTADAGFENAIERRKEGVGGAQWGPWTGLTTLETSESTYLDPSPSPAFYEYRMRANCSADPQSQQWSEYSNVMAVELPAVCQ
jgi:hypothetical protein